MTVAAVGEYNFELGGLIVDIQYTQRRGVFGRSEMDLFGGGANQKGPGLSLFGAGRLLPLLMPCDFLIGYHLSIFLLREGCCNTSFMHSDAPLIPCAMRHPQKKYFSDQSVCSKPVKSASRGEVD